MFTDLLRYLFFVARNERQRYAAMRFMFSLFL